MHLFYPLEETLKGLTDLPISLAALVIALLLRKEKITKPEQRLWGLFALILAYSAFLGAAVHTLDLGEGFRKAVWVILFPGLYALGCTMYLILTRAMPNGSRSVRPWLLIPAAVGLLASEILMLLGNDADILVFVAFGVLAVVPAFVRIFRRGFGWKHLGAMMLLLLAAALCQVLSFVSPYLVAVEHVFMLAAFVFYLKLAQYAIRQAG